MIDKISDWIGEKFGEELKERFSLDTYAGIALFVCVAWAHVHGEYHSALLSMLMASPQDYVREGKALSELPVYLLITSIGAGIAIPIFSNFIAKKYLVFISNLPKYRDHLQKCIAAGILQPELMPEHKSQEIVIVQQSLTRERDKARILVSTYALLLTLSVPILLASVFGNSLDLIIGLLLLGISAYCLHRTAKHFISSITPLHARFEALTQNR